MKVHQILPAISSRDGVSNDAITIRTILRKQGFKSEIYAKYIHPDVAKYAKDIKHYRPDARNILLYHFSLAGDDVTDFVKALLDTKGLIYHNITPPFFFENYDMNLQELCRNGLAELNTLPPYFFMGIGDSEYSRLTLEKVGFQKTETLPIFLNWEKLVKMDEKLKNDFSFETDVILLFVGRISPNKKIEDLIKVFYCFNKSINPNSKLILVGNKQIPLYCTYLKNIVHSLKLQDSVIFTGSVTDEKLRHYYEIADIFLCMSEHEGFCVPLLEAMYYGVPIIAYNSTAVPYTLNNCGILVNEKEYPAIAELINVLLEDKQLKERIIIKQRERLQDFTLGKTLPELLSIVKKMEDHIHNR